MVVKTTAGPITGRDALVTPGLMLLEPRGLFLASEQAGGQGVACNVRGVRDVSEGYRGGEAWWKAGMGKHMRNWLGWDSHQERGNPDREPFPSL